MTVKERIKRFEKENAPFTLYEHDNGRYSLGLRFTFFEGKYENYGQEAFNDYALQAGDPVKDGRFYTHGNTADENKHLRKADQHRAGDTHQEGNRLHARAIWRNTVCVRR